MSSHKQTWIKHLLSEKQMSEAFVNSVFLALSGGFQDAYTYNTSDEVFSNAQTGNVVLMSQNIMIGNFARGLYYLCPILAFILGVAIANFIEYKYKYAKKIHWRQGILIVEILLLFMVGFIPYSLNMAATTLVSFSCAMQVQAFRRVNGYTYASTMCIGNIRSGTAAFSVFLRERKKEQLIQAMHYFGIILFFALGAGIGGNLSRIFGIKMIWTSCVILLISFCIMHLEKWRE